MRMLPLKRIMVPLAVLGASLALPAAIPAAAWAAGAAPVRPATADGDSTPPGWCAVVDNLTEVSHLTFYDGGAPGPGPGDVVYYHDELYDAAGRQVGTSDGQALVYADPSNGELMESVTNTDHLMNGAVFSAGSLSVRAAAAGEVQSVYAVGTAGRYLNRTGTRSVQLVARVDSVTSISKASISVCR